MKKNFGKKAFLSGLIGAAAVLSLLTGCGGAARANAATSLEEKDPYKMAYVATTRDEYLGLLEDAVMESAAERGVDMEVFYAGADSMRMIDCVTAAKSKGKDAVLVNLNAAEDGKACIEAAGDMKVVFVNRVPDTYDILNENAAVVASDEKISGKYQGEFLADYFKKAGKTEVSYVLLRGTGGLVHTTLRTEGAVNALKKAGINVKEAAVVDGGYDRNTTKEQMDRVLPGLEFDCVISNNDGMALGALTAMKDAGIDPASVPVVGIDATEDGKEAIRSGEMAMTVFQSAKGQADGSVAAAINMLDGKDVAEGTNCDKSSESPYVLYYPFVPVTAENVNSIK